MTFTHQNTSDKSLPHLGYCRKIFLQARVNTAIGRKSIGWTGTILLANRFQPVVTVAHRCSYDSPIWSGSNTCCQMQSKKINQPNRPKKCRVFWVISRTTWHWFMLLWFVNAVYTALNQSSGAKHSDKISAC